MRIHSPIATDIFALVRPMEANTIAVVAWFKVGVNDPSLGMLLVASIYEGEYLLANKLIISIQYYLHFV